MSNKTKRMLPPAMSMNRDDAWSIYIDNISWYLEDDFRHHLSDSLGTYQYGRYHLARVAESLVNSIRTDIRKEGADVSRLFRE